MPKILMKTLNARVAFSCCASTQAKSMQHLCFKHSIYPSLPATRVGGRSEIFPGLLGEGFDDSRIFLVAGIMRRFCGGGSPGSLVLNSSLHGVDDESVCKVPG